MPFGSRIPPAFLRAPRTAPSPQNLLGLFWLLSHPHSGSLLWCAFCFISIFRVHDWFLGTEWHLFEDRDLVYLFLNSPKNSKLCSRRCSIELFVPTLKAFVTLNQPGHLQRSLTASSANCMGAQPYIWVLNGLHTFSTVDMSQILSLQKFSRNIGIGKAHPSLPAELAISLALK